MLTLGLTLKPWEGKNLVFPPCFSVHMAHNSGKIPLDLTYGWITFILQLFADVSVRGGQGWWRVGLVMLALSCNEVGRTRENVMGGGGEQLFVF